MAGTFRSSARQGQYRSSLTAKDGSKDRERDRESISDREKNRIAHQVVDQGMITAYREKLTKEEGSRKTAQVLETEWAKKEQDQKIANFKLKAEQAQLKAKSSIAVLQNLTELVPKAGEVITKFKENAEQAEIEQFQWIQRDLGITNEELLELRLTGLTYDQINDGQYTKLQKLFADKNLTAKQFNILTNKSGHITRAWQETDRDRINKGFRTFVAANAGNTIDMGGGVQITYSELLSPSGKYSAEQLYAAAKQAEFLYYKQDKTANTYKPSFLNGAESYKAYQSDVDEIRAGIASWDEKQNIKQAKEESMTVNQSKFVTGGDFAGVLTELISTAPEGTKSFVRDQTIAQFITRLKAGQLTAADLNNALEATYVTSSGQTFTVGSVPSIRKAVDDAIYEVTNRKLQSQDQIKKLNAFNAQAAFDKAESVLYSLPEDQQQAYWEAGRSEMAKNPDLVAPWNRLNPQARSAEQVKHDLARAEEATKNNGGIYSKQIADDLGLEGRALIAYMDKVHAQKTSNPGREDHITKFKSTARDAISAELGDANIFTNSSKHSSANRMLTLLQGRFLNEYNKLLGSTDEVTAYSEAVKNVINAAEAEFKKEGAQLFVQREKEDGSPLDKPIVPNLPSYDAPSLSTQAREAKERHGDNFLSITRIIPKNELVKIHREVNGERTADKQIMLRLEGLSSKYGVSRLRLVQKQLEAYGLEEKDLGEVFIRRMEAQEQVQQNYINQDTQRAIYEMQQYEFNPTEANRLRVQINSGEINPRDPSVVTPGFELQTNTSETFISRHLDHSYGPSEMKGFNYTPDPNHSGANGHLDLGFKSRKTNNWVHDFLAELGIVSTEVKDRGAGVTVAHNTAGEITHANGYKMDIPLDSRNGLKLGPLGNDDDYNFVNKVYRSIEFGLGQMETGRDPKKAAQMFASQDYVGAV